MVQLEGGDQQQSVQVEANDEWCLPVSWELIESNPMEVFASQGLV